MEFSTFKPAENAFPIFIIPTFILRFDARVWYTMPAGSKIKAYLKYEIVDNFPKNRYFTQDVYLQKMSDFTSKKKFLL